jgi:predicted RNA-binding Zn-ribbon protein involved in translation (DUF1610 family)
MTDHTQTDEPILQIEPVQGLSDYFCPFCGHKLFRGKVNRLNMVCENCNRLVTDTDITPNK